MSEKLNPNFKRVIMTGSMVLSIAYLLHQLTAKIRLPGRYLEDYYKRADELLKEYYENSPTSLIDIPNTREDLVNQLAAGGDASTILKKAGLTQNMTRAEVEQVLGKPVGNTVL